MVEKRQKLEAYCVPGHDHPCDMKKLALNRIDGTSNPPPSEEAIAAVGWRMPKDLATFHPVIDGLKLIEAQRRTKKPAGLWPNAPSIYGIGAYVQHTTVSQFGARATVIRRWPDKVGEKIRVSSEAQQASASGKIGIC